MREERSRELREEEKGSSVRWGRKEKLGLTLLTRAGSVPGRIGLRAADRAEDGPGL